MTKWTNMDYKKTPESYVQILESDVLLNSGDNPTKIYLYNPVTKSLILLPITTEKGSTDIAHTSTKLWLYDYFKSIEYNITLYPFSIAFSRYITGITVNAGLCAISDTLLIMVKYDVDSGRYMILEADITNDAASFTSKFALSEGEYITGDYVLTDTRKFICLTTKDSKNYISQYDYDTGDLEMITEITNLMGSAFGLFEYDNQIYIVDVANDSPNYSTVYTINKDTYEVEIYDSLSVMFNGASQIPSQINVSFTPNQ